MCHCPGDVICYDVCMCMCIYIYITYNYWSLCSGAECSTMLYVPSQCHTGNAHRIEQLSGFTSFSLEDGFCENRSFSSNPYGQTYVALLSKSGTHSIFTSNMHKSQWKHRKNRTTKKHGRITQAPKTRFTCNMYHYT